MKNSLKNKSEIDNLFENGKTISNGLLAIKWVESNDTKFLFAVSSKKFKRAVDRNKIKRLMREAFSKLTFKGKTVAVIYRGNEVPTLSDIKESLGKLMEKWK